MTILQGLPARMHLTSPPWPFLERLDRTCEFPNLMPGLSAYGHTLTSRVNRSVSVVAALQRP